MFNIIGKINQIVLLLAGLLIIFLIGGELIDKIRKRQPYERPKVAIEQPENEKANVEVKVETNFLLKVKDAYIFSLESNTIEPNKSRYPEEGVAEFRMPSWSYSRDQMVNMIFLKEDGTKVVLLERDALIGEFIPAKFESDELGNAFESNVYQIADEDSNNDGYLSEKDSFSIYVSNYDGTGLKKLIGDVARSFAMKNNSLIIRTGEKYESQYYIYNLLDDSLTKLDTDTLLKQSDGPTKSGQ